MRRYLQHVNVVANEEDADGDVVGEDSISIDIDIDSDTSYGNDNYNISSNSATSTSASSSCFLITLVPLIGLGEEYYTRKQQLDDQGVVCNHQESDDTTGSGGYGEYLPDINLLSNDNDNYDDDNPITDPDKKNNSATSTTTVVASQPGNYSSQQHRQQPTIHQLPRSKCNMISLTPLTTKSEDNTNNSNDTGTGRSTSYQYTPIISGYEEAVAKLLAIHHLNTGNGSLIHEVQGLDTNCPIRFELEFVDTHYDPGETMGQVAQILTHATNKKEAATNTNRNSTASSSSYQPQTQTTSSPCVFLGATTDVVTNPVSMMVNLNGYPIITGATTTIALDDPIQHPMLSRTVPSDAMIARALLEYLDQIDVHHLVIVSMDDEYGKFYAEAIGEVSALYKNRLRTVTYEIQTDGSNLDDVLQRIKKSQYRYIYFIHYGNVSGIHTIMERASKVGVAGNGKYTWIHSNNLPDYFFDSIRANDSTLQRAFRGTGFFGINGRSDSKIYKQFRHQLIQLKDSINTNNHSNKNNNEVDDDYYDNNKIWFNSHNDDNGNPFRYGILQDLLRNNTFLQIPPNRDFSPFHYESTILAGLAACSAVTTRTTIQSTNNTNTNTDADSTTINTVTATESTTTSDSASTEEVFLFLNGTEFDKAVRKTQFMGVSGFVALDENTGTRQYNTTYYTMDNLIEELYTEEEADYDKKSNEFDTKNDTDTHPDTTTNTELVEKVRFNCVTTDRMYDNNWTKIEPFVYNNNETKPLRDIPEHGLDPDIVHMGTLVVVFLLFAISVSLAIGLAVWTIVNRKTRIVRASQPFFLLMICGGCILFASAIISIAIDLQSHQFPDINYAGIDMDDYRESSDDLIKLADLELSGFHIHSSRMKISCTVTVWICVIGIGIIFSALFSKAYRINTIMRSSKRYRRIQVRVRDTLVPLSIFLFFNILILTLMSILAPIEYGILIKTTDDFDRPLRTIGRCDYSVSDHLKYLVPLVVLNLGMLCLAMYQSWKTRNLSTEFQESEQVFRALLSILLASFVGLPVLFLAKDNKDANLFVSSALIFVICVSILGQLYLPKLRYEKKRRTIQPGGGRWTSDAAVAHAATRGMLSTTTRRDQKSQVDSRSFVEGEIILSTKTRKQLIIENNKLRMHIRQLETQLNKSSPSSNEAITDITFNVPSERTTTDKLMVDGFESTGLQMILNETSCEFLSRESGRTTAADAMGRELEPSHYYSDGNEAILDDFESEGLQMILNETSCEFLSRESGRTTAVDAMDRELEPSQYNSDGKLAGSIRNP